jgi:hypothetical protein
MVMPEMRLQEVLGFGTGTGELRSSCTGRRIGNMRGGYVRENEGRKRNRRPEKLQTKDACNDL